MTGTSYLTHDEAALRDAAAGAVERATRAGADGASATARAGGGAFFAVRDGAVDTALRSGHQSLTVTAYAGGRRGVASTATLAPAAVRRAADEAVQIARRVQPDDDARLADPAWLAQDGAAPPLLAPSERGVAWWRDLAQALDGAAAEVAAALPAGTAARVAQAGATTDESASALATSTGFCRSAASSLHAAWLTVVAERTGAPAVQDYAQSQDRRAAWLLPPDALAVTAVGRAVARLGARPVAGGRYPVLFAARVAPALVYDLVAALGGAAQHSGATFLPGAIGEAVAAPHLDLLEDPFEPYGLASGGYDAEGVAGARRLVVEAGVATGYFLDAVAARRLGLPPTGNAGGPYNLTLSSREDGGDDAAMLRRLDRGLLVTDLLGGATDPVAGTWTQAVAGFWVEGGAVLHPVGDVTLAGRLPDMLRGIVAVGGTVERLGAVRSGSVLIDAMTVGGRA